MIRGVLFDYGGVVALGGRGVDIAKRLCLELELPENMAADVFIPLFQELTRGRLEVDAFWETVEARTDITVTFKQRNVWDDWWGVQPYPEMLAAVEALKKAGYPVGLLSNIIPPAKIKIAAGGGYDAFDFAILSSEVGYAKPDPEIYDLAMSHFGGLQPNEIVFVDDQEKCMPPAQALGMHTILATSTDQILAELRKLDLPV